MKRCVIYIRTSTSEQVGNKNLSLEAQVKQLEELAKKKNLKIDQTFIDRYSVSSQNQPAFSHLLQEVEFGKIKYILCRDFTRLARSYCDWPAIIGFFKKKGVKIITPQVEQEKKKAGFLLSEFVTGVIVAVNEHEQAIRSERIKRGIASRKTRLDQEAMRERVRAANLRKRKKDS